MVLLGDLAAALGRPLEGEPGLELTGLAALEDAGPSELSFVEGSRYGSVFRRSRAGVVLVRLDFDTEQRSCLRTPEPYADFARAVEIFFPSPVKPEPGIHPSAVVAPDATVGEGVSVGAGVVVGPAARIGDRTVIHPNTTIYARVQVGADCQIHSGVHLHEGVRIGNRVVIQSGAVLGGEGFGFAYCSDGRRVRIPHCCPVEVSDDVEIGANTTIDASHPGHRRLGHSETRTRIGASVKIDNLVQVAHGVEIGAGSTLCAQVGLAGGTTLGRDVYFAGAAKAKGHLHVGDGSLVGGMAGVSGSLASGSQVLGVPHMERRLFARVAVAWKRLPALLRRVRRIEERLGIAGED